MALELEQIQPWDGQSGTGAEVRGALNRNFEKLKDLSILAGMPIKDLFTSVDLLPRPGISGNNYLVGENLYVWSESVLDYVDIGSVKGQDGLDGIDGKDSKQVTTVAYDGTRPVLRLLTDGSGVSYPVPTFSKSDGSTTTIITEAATYTNAEALSSKVDKGGSDKTLKQVEDEIVQLAGEVNLKAAHGYSELETVKTLKEVDDTLNDNIKNVKNDLIKFVLGEDIDLETKPTLTDGYYINNFGGSLTTSPSAYSATLDFMPLYGAKKLHYFGRFGTSLTRLAFYSGTSPSSMVLVVPESNREIFDEIFDVPVEAKYYRVTCGVNAKNNFKVVLIGVGSSLKLESFRYVGAPVYENDAIKQSNVIWNDGSSGVVIFNNWNEENLTFTSFVATSIENGVTVTQPPVTFNSNNQITNYPNFIISEI
jgi:hypothetical protein